MDQRVLPGKHQGVQRRHRPAEPHRLCAEDGKTSVPFSTGEKNLENYFFIEELSAFSSLGSYLWNYSHAERLLWRSDPAGLEPERVLQLRRE